MESRGTFGHMLRVAALDAGFTQAQLAAATGLTRETVSRHMRGETEPRVSEVGLYALATGWRFVIDAPAEGLEPSTYRLTASAGAAA